MNWVKEYINQIEAGKIVCGQKVIKQYKKLLAEAEDKTSAYFFDEAKAERPIEFVERFLQVLSRVFRKFGFSHMVENY